MKAIDLRAIKVNGHDFGTMYVFFKKLTSLHSPKRKTICYSFHFLFAGHEIFVSIVIINNFVCRSYDPGYFNTSVCKSKITYIDGEKGILEYRGYPVEQLAEKSSFLEVAFLLIYGFLPNLVCYLIFHFFYFAVFID